MRLSLFNSFPCKQKKPTEDRRSDQRTPQKQQKEQKEQKEDGISFVLENKHEKLLAGRLWCMRNGNQLGNQIYEILGFASIAKKVGRRPVFLLQSDPIFNANVVAQIWNSLLYFPHIFDGFYIQKTTPPSFQIDTVPLVKLKRHAASEYQDLTELYRFEQEPIVNIEVDLLQNYRYLDELGRDDVRARLRFTNSTLELLEFLVPSEFYQRENRICVHLRRGDFGGASSQFADVSKSLKFIQNREKMSDSFGIILFTDDHRYAKKMSETENAYKEFLNQTWFPKPKHPRHLVWAFFANHCTHIVLTRIQSTFGFFGAYIAPETTKIYYNPAKAMGRVVSTPDTWIPVKVTDRK